MSTASAGMQSVLSALSSITGAAHLREEDSWVAVAPANAEELASVLRFANEQRLPVTPRGGGTKQRWGHPVAPAIMLESHRMQAVTEHTWQDMTCSVEAGCTWSALQATLAKHAQFVALDPLWPDRATVGGIVATNDSGVLRLRYGGLRDLIIGMTVALPDGTLAKTGGKVVKNVAGYDLHKLMTGAFGTLGVITSVNFRLHARPQCVQTFTITAPDAESLGKLMIQLLHGQLSTVAIQLRAMAHGCSLDIRLASLAEVLQTQAEVLAQLAHAQGLSMTAAREEVWEAREHLMEAAIVCKATMLPSEVGRLADYTRSLGGESVTQATGIMTASFPVAAAERIASLRSECEAGHGSLMVLQQPAETNLPIWGQSPDSLPLMRKIKENFDPQCILNAGRFLGGI